MKLDFQYKARKDKEGNAYNLHVSLVPDEKYVFVVLSPYINSNSVTVTSKNDLETMINKCRRDGWRIVDKREMT